MSNARIGLVFVRQLIVPLHTALRTFEDPGSVKRPTHEKLMLVPLRWIGHEPGDRTSHRKPSCHIDTIKASTSILLRI